MTIGREIDVIWLFGIVKANQAIANASDPMRVRLSIVIPANVFYEVAAYASSDASLWTKYKAQISSINNSFNTLKTKNPSAFSDLKASVPNSTNFAALSNAPFKSLHTNVADWPVREVDVYDENGVFIVAGNTCQNGVSCAHPKGGGCLKVDGCIEVNPESYKAVAQMDPVTGKPSYYVTKSAPNWGVNNNVLLMAAHVGQTIDDAFAILSKPGVAYKTPISGIGIRWDDQGETNLSTDWWEIDQKPGFDAKSYLQPYVSYYGGDKQAVFLKGTTDLTPDAIHEFSKSRDGIIARLMKWVSAAVETKKLRPSKVMNTAKVTFYSAYGFNGLMYGSEDLAWVAKTGGIGVIDNSATGMGSMDTNDYEVQHVGQRTLKRYGYASWEGELNPPAVNWTGQFAMKTRSYNFDATGNVSSSGDLVSSVNVTSPDWWSSDESKATSSHHYRQLVNQISRGVDAISFGNYRFDLILNPPQGGDWIKVLGTTTPSSSHKSALEALQKTPDPIYAIYLPSKGKAWFDLNHKPLPPEYYSQVHLTSADLVHNLYPIEGRLHQYDVLTDEMLRSGSSILSTYKKILIPLALAGKMSDLPTDIQAVLAGKDVSFVSRSTLATQLQ